MIVERKRIKEERPTVRQISRPNDIKRKETNKGRNDGKKHVQNLQEGKQ